MSQDMNSALDVQRLETQPDDFLLGMTDGQADEKGTAQDDADVRQSAHAANVGDGEEQGGDQAPEQTAPPKTFAAAPTQAASYSVDGEPVPVEQERQEERPAAAKVSIDDDIKDEWEELRKLSPEAAALAEEDSPEGVAVRNRLGSMGADSALDRADITIDRRKKADEARQRTQQVVTDHNARFQAVLQREVPEVVAMSQDPARMQEAAKFTHDMQAWIEGKPYAEAASLMEIYKHGRDPYQVAGMIKQFKQECGVAQARPKPSTSAENMIAVPTRGAPVAPVGAGDSDDFYAGLSLNQ